MNFLKSQFSPYPKECDKYIIRSPNHEMYLQLLKKPTLPSLDAKRCYESKIISKPWENM